MIAENDTKKKENKQINLKFEQLRNLTDEALKFVVELSSKLEPLKLNLPKVDKNQKGEEASLCSFANVINIEIIKITEIIDILKNNLEEIQF